MIPCRPISNIYDVPFYQNSLVHETPCNKAESLSLLSLSMSPGSILCGIWFGCPWTSTGILLGEK